MAENEQIYAQGQRRQRASDVMRGQHLSRVVGDATAGRRVGRLRDGAQPLAAAPPARHAPPQAPLHATPEAHEDLLPHTTERAIV